MRLHKLNIATIILTSMTLYFSSTAQGECIRWKPSPRAADVAPDLDGPGSFGALQDTVTLDCLTYVGSIQKNGAEHVRIKDETGKIHLLRRGAYMGENSGLIKKIDRDTIYIEQVIQKDGEWTVVMVEFPKRRKNS